MLDPPTLLGGAVEMDLLKRAYFLISIYNSIVHDHLCDTRLPTIETLSFLLIHLGRRLSKLKSGFFSLVRLHCCQNMTPLSQYSANPLQVGQYATCNTFIIRRLFLPSAMWASIYPPADALLYQSIRLWRHLLLSYYTTVWFFLPPTPCGLYTELTWRSWKRKRAVSPEGVGIWPWNLGNPRTQAWPVRTLRRQRIRYSDQGRKTPSYNGRVRLFFQISIRISIFFFWLFVSAATCTLPAGPLAPHIVHTHTHTHAVNTR